MMSNKLYVIEWVGPFENMDSLMNWEKENNADHLYNFYIVTGKLPKKRKVQSYCGITQNKDGFVYKRYQCDTSHIVHKMRDEEIWIGKFSDSEIHPREDIELCETMIISYWQPELNKKKKSYFPTDNIVLVNRWFKPSFEPRQKCKYAAQEMSDLIILDDDAIWGTEKIKKLRDLNE